MEYNRDYPSVEELIRKAKRNIPRFAFEYLDGGCNEDVNLLRNTAELREVQLRPEYIRRFSGTDLSCELFGERYAAPFGMAPVGLQGLIYPNAPEILAAAASAQDVPFVLSTVSTTSIERIAEITGGKFWFQLYHPAEEQITDDLLDRAEAAGCKVLVALCDVPGFGFRPRDIRNGLSMPPRMSLKNMIQIAGRPGWALRTLRHGKPGFATMERYMPKGMNMKALGAYMDQTFSGRLDEEKLMRLRDRWKGKLVLKGVASPGDAAVAARLGLDGIIVSNHGGRQLDAGESSIASLRAVLGAGSTGMQVMLDSGLRSGVDVARAISCGADFTFLGRTFMYGVAALGRNGGMHTVSMLKVQLRQVMEQLCCSDLKELPDRLVGH